MLNMICRYHETNSKLVTSVAGRMSKYCFFWGGIVQWPRLLR